MILLGCQAGASTPPPPIAAVGSGSSAVAAKAPEVPMVVAATPYANDVQKICNAVHLSGADNEQGGAPVIVANWLAGNIETTQGHDFLVEIAPLVGAAKADRLDAEAKKVGLPGCALSAMWRVPGATMPQ